ncbi:MAG TPA: hypothetical protein P5121_29755, partial [Caldilineaceae bacterium]|nr:hypothetical protein [Caldilineaceae bacterium]
MGDRIIQLYNTLEAALVGEQLVIQPTIIPIPQITTLVERLPHQQLVLHGATIQLQPATLTVMGRSLQAWPVRGIVAAQIKEMDLHLLITENQPDSSLSATLTVAGGNLSLGQISLTVSGSYEHDVFQLGLQTPPPATFALATLTDLATNGDLVSYLPTVPLLFDAVSLSEFTLHFSFVETIPTELILGVNILGDWPIVESPIALRLRNLQATILSHWTLVDEELLAFTAGNLLGTLQIGQDFDIRLPFLGGHLLEIDVIPHNGDLLLGLPAIAEWLGGVTLRNAVQNGLAALDLGEIVLDEVRIVFNIASKSLFSLGILSHIHLIDLQSGLNVVVDLYLQPPLGEAAGWQFAGTTGTGQALPIGKLILYLAHKFNLAVATPTVLESLVIDNLGIAFNTQTGDVSFTCRGHLQIGVDSAGRAEQVEAQVTIEVTRNATTQSYSVTFRGYLLVEGLQFDLNFSYDPTATSLVAAFDHSQNNVTNVAGENFNSFFGDTIRVHNLLSQISPEVASIIPESLEVELKNVLFAYSRHDSARKFLFGPNIGVHISLADLPLVGHTFPTDQTLGFDDLQLLFVSNPLTLLETNSLNTLIPDHVNKLPTTALVDANGQPTAYALAKGFSVAARLRLGDTLLPLSFTVGTSQPSPLRALPVAGVARANAVADTTTTPVRWIKIQRSFGPLHFARIGVLYQDGAILILLDASLAVSGLTLALDGLAVGSKLDHFSPEFRLNGLSVDYRNGPVELGGALLRVAREGREEYDGAVILRTTALTLGALGSYTYFNGHPSFFVYALLDYPLGGPAFFFVTGLAAGFGFNRRLTMPTIDQVATFPLVQWASDPASSPTANNQGSAALLGALTGLASYIPPSTGDYFLAVGIKFTSFKLLDSFALLAVAFGKRFELDLLGLSTLIAPTPIPGEPAVSPLAEAQLALKASFIPA